MLRPFDSLSFLVQPEGEVLGERTTEMAIKIADRNPKGLQGPVVSLCFSRGVRPRIAIDEVHEGGRSKFVLIGEFLLSIGNGTLPKARINR